MLSYTTTHAWNRCCLKSVTSCAFCGRLTAPDFVIKCTEVWWSVCCSVVRSLEVLRVSYIVALFDWRRKWCTECQCRYSSWKSRIYL